MTKIMTKKFEVKAADGNYDIEGETLLQAIERNFEKIARKAYVGNAAGYRLQEARAEYAVGILGGAGGCRLTVKHAGQKLANGFDGEEKTTEIWIYARREDIADPHVFEFKA